ncbi:DUF6636 domain-containing protein [Rhodococcus sp. 05-2254-6]|uniref:DUF6636 domain-containing protein n=1 Tax=Rhodococcus sp. 05-2254-6 TaxID=2022489 RepID=UPI00117B0FD4|nr:DUF6636 domain-containing protein [Rhodococcus sp. 05-2254-6]
MPEQSTLEVSTTDPPPSPPPAAAISLVDPATFARGEGGLQGFFFTTPSGLWRCAILADSAQGGSDDQMAGCQPSSSMPMNVAGAPSVPDHYSRNATAPNAILVNATEDARFASLSQALFWRYDTTPVLPYGQTLSANGFSCNVKESGVSCRSDDSGKGFTFSTGGYQFDYIEARGPATPVSTAASSGVDPVLGNKTDSYQVGYGEVRPPKISNGGASLSGIVTDIVWDSWGGPTASGTGTTAHVTPQFPAPGSAPQERASIVAFDLGECDGVPMYRSFVWFFPQDQSLEAAKANAVHAC